MSNIGGDFTVEFVPDDGTWAVIKPSNGLPFVWFISQKLAEQYARLSNGQSLVGVKEDGRIVEKLHTTLACLCLDIGCQKRQRVDE